MANLKYNEETKIISFRVPVSKIPTFREKVNNILLDMKENIVVDAKDIISKVPKERLNRIRNLRIKKPTVYLDDFEIRTSAPKHIEVDFEISINEPTKSIDIDLVLPKIKDCDCKLDENGFLRRGKIKCTKTKSQHKF